MMRMFFVVVICACMAAGAQDMPSSGLPARPMPFYLREFLRTMGVDPAPFELEATYNLRIAESVKAAGAEAVLSRAKAALDPYTGSPYFLVKETDRYILVGKRYAVSDALITIEVFFYRDNLGNIERILYTEGSMR
jgi:hypothetical protein